MLQAFLNDKKLKSFYLTRVKDHAKADEIVKGRYWENGKGCAVGCTIHDSDHSKYQTELGIPTWLARVEDTFFENMPNHLAKTWPARFLQAVNVGADLDKIKAPFMIYILEQNFRYFDSDKFSDVAMALHQVIELWKTDPEQINTEAWSAAAEAAEAAAEAARSEAAEAARSAARSAASSAAEAAASSAAEAAEAARSEAARSAASSAAEAAASSAAWSAWSARSAAWSARSAAWSAAFVEYSETLLKMMKGCK